MERKKTAGQAAGSSCYSEEGGRERKRGKERDPFSLARGKK